MADSVEGVGVLFDLISLLCYFIFLSLPPLDNNKQVGIASVGLFRVEFVFQCRLQ